MNDDIDFSEVDQGTPAPTVPADAPPKKVAELDAVIPEADDIDEDFRGKPLTEVIRVAKQHKEEAKKGYAAGAELNNARSRAEMAERMLAVFQQRQTLPQGPSADQVVTEFTMDPQGTVGRMVQQNIAPLVQTVQELQLNNYKAETESARLMARRNTPIDDSTWDELRGPLASIMFANQWDGRDPRAWKQSFDIYSKGMQALGQKATIPTSPGVPVGAARAQGRRDSAPALSARDERNLAELAEMSGIKKGTPAWDQLVKDIQNDPVAMGAYNG